MVFSPVRCLCGEVIRHTKALLRSRAKPVNVYLRASEATGISSSIPLTDEAVELLRRAFAGKYMGENGPELLLPLLRKRDGRLAVARPLPRMRPIYRSIGLGWWQHMGWLTPFGHRIPRDAALGGGDFAINRSAAPLLSSSRGIEP
ncbi:hypothetical protein GCM10009429_21150 [Dyella marensis]